LQEIRETNRQDLERLEGIIERNLQSFYEVGRALMEIRDKGDYRDVLGFETFEAYCKAKWDISRQHAYRFIDSAKVLDNVTDRLQIAPANLEQTRPLARLEPEAQREAWQQAVETAPQGKVTAAHVQKVVKAYQLEGGKRKWEAEPAPDEESIKLMNLKIAWRAANKRDKREFLKWVNERRSLDGI